MEPSFWHQKWQLQQIGFHQQQVNPFLVKYWPSLAIAETSGVFVPLCGKSLDMCYLAELRHGVLGCELNPLAVEQFFSENDLSDNILNLTDRKMCLHIYIAIAIAR